MLRKLLGAVLLLVAVALLALTALVLYRQHGGKALPKLPDKVESGVEQVEGAAQGKTFHGVRAEYVAGGAVALLLLLAWALLRRRIPEVQPIEERPSAAKPVHSSRAAWLIALLVLGACAGLIAALYYGPDDLRLTSSIQIHRGPRAEFLKKLAWGGSIIVGLHLLYFAVSLLPRLFAGADRRTPGRRAR